DVGFLNLDVGRAPFDHVYALVVLVDGNRETLLGFLLTDHVVVEEFLDLDRLRQRWASSGGFLLLIIGDDLVADIDALIADINGRAGNQLLDFVLGLSAKRAAQCVVATSHPISDLANFFAPFREAPGNDERGLINDELPAYSSFIIHHFTHGA